MKCRAVKTSNHKYWLIGNSIDGVCCFPHRRKVDEQELIKYLVSEFLADFNTSRGEFDFTIYLHRRGFRLRRRFGYYLKGQRTSVIAQADYMTADAIQRVLRRGRTFWYYGYLTATHKRHLLRIALPSTPSKSTGLVQCVRTKKGNNDKETGL